jgi:squid-like protein
MADGYQSQENTQNENTENKNEQSKPQETGDKQQATAGIPGKDDERKLFVGGLTRNTTESELKEHFSKFGDIESVSIKMDPYTGVSRGFAFIVFQNAKTIDKLLSTSCHYINKRKVYS